MKQTSAAAGAKKRAGRKSEQGRRARGVLAVFVAVIGLAMAVLACTLLPSVTSLFWGGAAILMLVEAALIALPGHRPALVYILLGLVCLGLVVAGPFGTEKVYLDGSIAPKEYLITDLRLTDSYPENFDLMAKLRRLDMRDSTLTDFTPLLDKSQLQKLDIRGNYAFTEASRDMLRSAAPGCDILWSMPVGSQYFDSDATAVDISAQSLTAGQIQALMAEHPGVEFTYRVTLLDTAYDPSVEALDLRGQPLDAAAIDEALTLLTRVNAIDLRGTPASADTIASMKAAHPQIQYAFTCAVPVPDVTTDDAIIVMTGGKLKDVQTCISFIPHMPNLQTIDARAATLSAKDIQTLREDPAFPMLVLSIQAHGRTFTTLDTQINLDGVTLNDTSSVEALLACMPNVTSVSMCECGVSNEKMAALQEKYPEIRFVWVVHFAQYKLRTDATMFTTNLTSINQLHYTSATFAPLKYCTELRFVDLGHCDVRNIDALARMTGLRVLILADNKVTDISALAGLEELEYVELFLNNIRDLSPLADKKNLRDVNLFYNENLKDITPLESCPSLERLWIGGCPVPESQLNHLKQVVPDVYIYKTIGGSTSGGWRDHPHYTTIQQMYQTREYIPFE